MAFAMFYTTHPDEATAKRVARTLVEERLAACYNVLPMQSCFFWENALVNDDEWVAILKTRTALIEALTRRFEALHPYEVPCCMHWEVNANAAYERWIMRETRDGTDHE